MTFLAAIEPGVFTACLAPAIYYDIRKHRLPDVFPALAAGLLLLLRAAQRSLRLEQFLGAAAGFAVFFGFWAISKGRLGFGDVKLSALVGFLVGPAGWILAVFLASLGALLAILARRLALGVPLGRRVAFGPFLIAGGLASYFLAGPLLSLL